MATSGSKTFYFPVDRIIRTAIGRVGGEWTNAEEQERARDELNLLMFTLINNDAPLGSIKELSVSVGTSDASFSIQNGTIGILDAIVRTPTIVSTGTSSNEYSSTSYTDTPLGRMSFVEFHAIADKTKASKPSLFTTTVSNQELVMKIWPINDTVPRTILYNAIVQPDVVTRSTQELDIMNRYIPAIIEGLAYRIGKNRKGISTERLNTIKNDYKEMLQEAKDADKERTSMFARPVIRKGR